MTSGYDAEKVNILSDLFGAEVWLGDDELITPTRQYPIVDDVIVLLPQNHYPKSVRKRITAAEEPLKETLEFSELVQHGFGEEWRQYGEVLPDHAEEFCRYFDVVDLRQLGEIRICDLDCGGVGPAGARRITMPAVCSCRPSVTRAIR